MEKWSSLLVDLELPMSKATMIEIATLCGGVLQPIRRTTIPQSNARVDPNKVLLRGSSLRWLPDHPGLVDVVPAHKLRRIQRIADVGENQIRAVLEFGVLLARIAEDIFVVFWPGLHLRHAIDLSTFRPR